MLYLPLTDGTFAIIDDEDYQRLSQWTWKPHKGRSDNIYAVRSTRYRVLKGAGTFFVATCRWGSSSLPRKFYILSIRLSCQKVLTVLPPLRENIFRHGSALI